MPLHPTRFALLVTTLSMACQPTPSVRSGGAEQLGEAEADAGPSMARRVRGRITALDGTPLGDVEVSVDGQKARTDARGHFSVPADPSKSGTDLKLSVEDARYSSGELPVRVSDSDDAHVEVTVVERKKLVIVEAQEGGRMTGEDGLVLEVPKQGLRKKSGEAVSGPVDAYYAVIDEPKEAGALPGRMETKDEGQIEGYGIVEVRFRQDGEWLELTKAVTLEVPIVAGAGFKDGDSVPSYQVASDGARWGAKGVAQVKANRAVITTDEPGWVGVAKPMPVDSCVSGTLLRSSAAAALTTIRAARARGLSLVQAQTQEDGSFCLPVTPDDDWRVSAYYDDEKSGRALSVDVRSNEARGMCGGDGCKEVGAVELPALNP